MRILAVGSNGAGRRPRTDGRRQTLAADAAGRGPRCDGVPMAGHASAREDAAVLPSAGSGLATRVGGSPST